MKSWIALFLIVGAGIAASVAFAAGPQGNLTGAANLSDASTSRIAVGTTVTDGETVYTAQQNDLSGDCNGDAGVVAVKHGAGAAVNFNIFCAHFVHSAAGKNIMVFSYSDTTLGNFPVVWIRDDGSPASADTIRIAYLPTAARAQKMVNLGWDGSGELAAGTPLPFVTGSSGDYTVTP